MLWAQSIFLEALLKVNIPALSISDFALEHVYNGFFGGIADGGGVGGGILKTELLTHGWEHAV